jgi:hypothetical protein
MRCRSCQARLTYEDNYCRKCGAAVDIVEVEVVRSSPARELSTIRAAAVPVVAQGTAMIAAGALLRFAIKAFLSHRQAPSRGLLPSGRGAALADGEVEELVYYRRTRVR